MCGIAAISGKDLDIKKYQTDDMLKALENRGPDGSGEVLFSNCWVGHRRLSIVDLDMGKQPMTDGNLTISFNGEIYNNLELREQLEKAGYIFKTKSDTETILKAYRAWGSECVAHLDGIFAFVIWDNSNNEMFIVRDRLGQKPIYYFFDNETIVVASEIKSLLASGVLVPQLDLKAIDNYLRVMYVLPWRSIYKNVFQIPPAHYGIFKDGKISLKRYWKLNYKPITISYDNAKKEVHRLLRVAVKKRVENSDVEVGVFLSGGLDSSLVSIFAAKELNYKIKAFSVSYNGHDELPFAKKVCEKINGEHYVVKIDKCLTDEISNLIYYFDEPHADTSDFPQHLVSDLASQKVKVILSGDGADELFLGYKWHIESNDSFNKRLYSICAFTESQRRDLWGGPDFINDDIIANDVYSDLINPIDCVTMFDVTSHLPGQILAKIDRAGMMHGLEVRSPFLDIDLIEFVFNLPYEYKVNNGDQKHILKDILLDYMPADFVNRQKQGFGAPIEKWLRDPKIKEYVYNKIGYGKIRSFLSGNVLDSYLQDFYVSEKCHERTAQRIWVLLCLEIWISGLKLSYEE